MPIYYPYYPRQLVSYLYSYRFRLLLFPLRRTEVMGRQLATLRWREFLLASETLALVGTVGNTKAFSAGSRTFTKCTSSGKTCVNHSVRSNGEPFSELAIAARRSVTTARACIEYFNSGLAMPNHDLQEGLNLAEAVVAGCEAVALLASSQSPYLANFSPSAVRLLKPASIIATN